MILRHSSGEIAWTCDICGDEGVIRGWEGSPVDASGLDDSYAEGDNLSWVVTRDLFKVIHDVPVLDAASELLIARAEGHAAGVMLTGRADAFEELIEYVASQANAETDRGRMRRLYETCTVLEAALVAE